MSKSVCASGVMMYERVNMSSISMHDEFVSIYKVHRDNKHESLFLASFYSLIWKAHDESLIWKARDESLILKAHGHGN